MCFTPDVPPHPPSARSGRSSRKKRDFFSTHKHAGLSKQPPKYPLFLLLLLLRLSWKGGVTLSRMKGSRYLVMSYFRAPRLPLRSRATGERGRQTETQKEKKKRERERGPRPITSPVRVTADRERGRQERVREERDTPPHLPLSHFYLCPPSPNSPFDSPSLPPLRSFPSPSPLPLPSLFKRGGV